MKTTTPHELHQQLPNALLLDVRTPAEFAAAHIPGSRLVPLHQLSPDHLAQLDPQRPCFVICQSGKRAAQAAEKLAAAGHPQAIVLEGGINAWQAAGLPLNLGQGGISIERQTRIAAGSLVLLGLILGSFNPLFYLLSGFVGCGLIFAGITDWCGMGLLLARMPWNNRNPACACS